MTKKSIVTLALLCTLVSTANAADTKSRRGSTATTPPADSTIYTSSSAPTYAGSSGGKFGLGYAATGIGGGTAGVLGTSAVTGLFNLSSGDMIQVLFAVPSTVGDLSLGVGGVYKHSISEHQGAGFHLGGGLALGTIAGDFAISMAAIAGLRFSVPGTSAIQIHLDGGPSFSLISTSPNSQSSFAISALSTALGLSVFYIF
jgi:hypothetical protein